MVAAFLELTVIGFCFNALLLYASYDTSGSFVGQFLEPFPIRQELSRLPSCDGSFSCSGSSVIYFPGQWTTLDINNDLF